MQTACMKKFKALRREAGTSKADAPWTVEEKDALEAGTAGRASESALLALLKTDKRLAARGKARLVPLVAGKTNPPRLNALHASAAVTCINQMRTLLLAHCLQSMHFCSPASRCQCGCNSEHPPAHACL